MRISDWSSDVCSSDLGGRMRRPGDVDPATIGIVLEINGEAAALACSGAVLGHPARAVQMLVAWLHERGRILPAGSVVLTGAATEAMPIDKGDIVCARFQAMEIGRASCRERGCQSVLFSLIAVYLKKKQIIEATTIQK